MKDEPQMLEENLRLPAVQKVRDFALAMGDNSDACTILFSALCAAYQKRNPDRSEDIQQAAMQLVLKVGFPIAWSIAKRANADANPNT